MLIPKLKQGMLTIIAAAFLSIVIHLSANQFVTGDGESFKVNVLFGNTEQATFDLTLTVNTKQVYFQAPCGIGLGNMDDLYVSDCGRHVIFRIFANESVVVVGGLGYAGVSPDGLNSKYTLFNSPSSLGVALNGDVYVADTDNNKIRIISSSTGLVSSIAHDFKQPLGVFVSSNNIVYIADTGNNLIKKYDISTSTVSVIGGGGYLDGSIDNVDAKLLLLNAPTNIHVVSNGKSDTVYFTDSERVKSIDSNGMYKLVDGTLSKFYGIHVSASNEIWTSSSNSHFVQKKKIGDSQTTIIGGKDLPDYYGDGLVDSYSQVRFYEPTSLVVKNSMIYIADRSNNCIRKIDTINKIVTTYSGGIINHNYGEDIPPLECSPSSNLRNPFYYRNELYYVEGVTCIRKVSNGLVKTIFGSILPLKTEHTLTRKYLVINHVSSFGNGEIVLSTNTGVFILNVDTLKFYQISPMGSLFNAICGASVENGTIFFVDSSQIVLYRSTYGNDSNQVMKFSETMSTMALSSDCSTIYAKLETKLVKLDLSNLSIETIPISIQILKLFYNNEKLYLLSFDHIHEMKLSDYSYQLVAGLKYNISGNSLSLVGYNGENLPALKSALSSAASSFTVQNSGTILVGNQVGSFICYITEISNGTSKTRVGRTPTSVTRRLLSFSRDETERLIYFLDSKVLKMYNESSGITTSLTQCVSADPAQVAAQVGNPLPFDFLNTNMLNTQAMLTFSKFDRMLYILENCRILKVDPTTMKFVKIVGNSCGSFTENIDALQSPISTLPFGISVNPNNGDVYFATLNTILKLEKSTGMIRVLFTHLGTANASPDGMVTNSTSIGLILYFTVVNDDIYFSTSTLVRVLERQSNGGYYLRTLIGNGQIGYSGDNLPALQSSISSISVFHVKQNGDIILVDGNSYIVRKYVKKTGLLLDIAGTPNQKSNHYMGDLNGLDTYFISLGKSISVNEKTDDIYVIDGSLVRKISVSCNGKAIFNAINNTCVCLSGYYGNNCLPHSCNGTLATDSNTCSGNGECTDFDVCVCKSGYKGQYCQIGSKLDNTDATKIVSIVVPIVLSFLLIVFVILIGIIIVTCCLNVKKKRRETSSENIATLKSKTVELSDFPSDRSIVMSSSMGSLGSENEDAFSRYTDIVRIGQGAFGSVYKVKDTKQGNKTKAVKVIHFQTFSDLNTVMKEASQLSFIKHANVVKVNDYFVTNDNLLCIDMDYYEKGDLTQFYKENCPEKTVKQILKQMCDALNYVHNQLSIIHRDIKPSNIFVKSLSSDFNKIEIVLADFGLAKKHQEMNLQSYAGTPIYMSPEIALGSSYSFNTDIFSLGVSIYQIMTKDTTTSISSLLMGNQNGQSILTQQMKQTNVEYSDELIQIILHMVDRNQQTRPGASDILSNPYLN